MVKHLVLKEDKNIRLLNELRGELLIQDPTKNWTDEEAFNYAAEVALKKFREGV